MKNRFWALVIRNPETKEITRVIVPPGRKCTECGLCCVWLRSAPYNYEEAGNLPPSYKVFTTIRSNKRKIYGGDQPVCPAFCGTLYKACSCAVQDKKPSTCVRYERGGNGCRAKIFGYEQLLYKEKSEEPFIVTSAEAKRRFHIIVKKDGTWRKAA